MRTFCLQFAEVINELFNLVGGRQLSKNNTLYFPTQEIKIIPHSLTRIFVFYFTVDEDHILLIMRLVVLIFKLASKRIYYCKVERCDLHLEIYWTGWL